MPAAQAAPVRLLHGQVEGAAHPEARGVIVMAAYAGLVAWNIVSDVS